MYIFKMENSVRTKNIVIVKCKLKFLEQMILKMRQIRNLLKLNTFFNGGKIL